MSMQVQPVVRQPKALSLEEAERILLVYDYADKVEVEACLAGIKGKQKWLHLIFSETPIPEADMTPEKLVCTRQVHTDTVRVVTAPGLPTTVMTARIGIGPPLGYRMRFSRI